MTIGGQDSMRLPGPLGNHTGLGGRTPGPVRRRLVRVADAPKPSKTFDMPPPLHDRTKHAHEVKWKLFDGDPAATDVRQGDLANCPVASILAAMAHTQVGRKRILGIVEEHLRPVITDLASVFSDLDDDPEANQERRIKSNRYFTVKILKGTEVSDVLYTDAGDRDTWNLIYMQQEPLSPKAESKKRVLWPAVIEKGYADLKNGYPGIESLKVEETWKTLVGSDPQPLYIDNVKDEDIKKVASAASKVPTISASRDDMELPEKDRIETRSGGKISGWHGYAVLGLTSSGVQLYDPHGKTIKLSFKEFRTYFVAMYSAK